MKNSFFGRIACFGIMFIIGVLANSKVSAEQVLIWMELESRTPISSSDGLTECCIGGFGGRKIAQVGRSVFKKKKVHFEGEDFYLREDEDSRFRDARRMSIMSEDDELELTADHYHDVEYYLTKLAYRCDIAEAQRLLDPRRDHPFEGTIMKPVVVEIGGKRINAYLSFGNRVITPLCKIIRAQDVRPFEPIPRFDAKHIGENNWEFNLELGSGVLRPILQEPLM